MDAVIFDIDGTISNCLHRIELWKEKNYAEFNKKCDQDVPINGMVDLVLSLAKDKKIIFLTGRSSVEKEKTRKWIKEYFNLDKDDYLLFMRPIGYEAKDAVFKKMIYMELIFEYNIKLVFEDRSEVVEMWRDLGLTCLQLPDNFLRNEL